MNKKQGNSKKTAKIGQKSKAIQKVNDLNELMVDVIRELEDAIEIHNIYPLNNCDQNTWYIKLNLILRENGEFESRPTLYCYEQNKDYEIFEKQFGGFTFEELVQSIFNFISKNKYQIPTFKLENGKLLKIQCVEAK